jgi:hypothetical protein
LNKTLSIDAQIFQKNWEKRAKRKKNAPEFVGFDLECIILRLD